MSTTTEAPTKSLVSKLAEVMKAVSSVPKRGHNSFHNYDYATEADIVAALRVELANRHVMILPAVTGKSREPVGDKGSVLTLLDMEFTFIDGETGETLTRPWLGSGTDKEDKAAYKAMTGGEKYFLLKTFLIPTGDDPEQDRKQDRDPRQQGQAKRQQRREVTTSDGAKVDPQTGEEKAPPKSNGAHGLTIDAKQQHELIKTGQANGWKGPDFAAYLKARGYGEWKHIPAGDFTGVLTRMQNGPQFSGDVL